MANFFDYLDKEEKKPQANFFDYLDTETETQRALGRGRGPKQPTAQRKPFIPDEVTKLGEAPAVSPFDIAPGTEVPTGMEPPEEIKELPPKPVVKFDELVKPENMKVIRDYAETRFGKAGKQKEGESDQDYVKRWMGAMRMTEWNTALNAVPELNWIYNSTDEQLLKAAAAYELYDKIPDWYDEGGQPGIRPFLEATGAMFSDPTVVASFGIGALARYKAARAGINAALKAKIAGIGGGAAAESALAVGESAIQQQIKIETGRQEKIDKVELAISGGLGLLVGGVEARAAFRKPPVSTKEDLEKVLASRTKTPVDKTTQAVMDSFEKNMEATLREFDKAEGRKILDDISPPVGGEPPVVVGEIEKSISYKAIKVAEYILLNDPNYSKLVKEVATDQVKVSRAVNVVFSDLDGIDDAVLEAALGRVGMTPAQFADAALTTVSDAASVMQGYSSLRRVIDRVGKLDPEAQKIIDAMYGKDNDVTSAAGWLSDGIRRLERESKALVVSSIATTVRNAYGSTTALTFDAGARFLESSLYSFGKGLKAVATGSYETGDLSRNLNTIVRDTFGTLTYLTNAGITAEVTDRILVDNPKLRDVLFHALQETGNQDLTKISRMANTFNVAQDVMFRRAVFTASIERQLRNVGMDMYQLIADGKAIPKDIMENAGEDALKATFSYMPKPQKAGTRTVEAKAEGLANKFVRFFEDLPGGSLAVTFPRFMANAMAFQYKYSPVGAASGVQELAMAGWEAFKKNGNQDKANRLYREGLEKFSRGAVGSAIIAWAYNYRLNNQDTEFYNIKNEDGSTVDTRSIFPIAPYLAAGEFLAKMKLGRESEIKVGDLLEVIVGMKMPAGTQASMLNQLPELFAQESGKEIERFEKAFGTVMGDFVGRFIQPGQPVFTYFDMFDREAQVARDPNAAVTGTWDSYFDTSIPGVRDYPIARETAVKRIYGKLPELKEELPEAVRYIRPGQETPMRGGEFFNVLIGARVVPSVNKIEREFKDLGLDPFTFYGASGDKTYDRELIKNSGKHINKIVVPLIESRRYGEMTSAQKRLALGENTRIALSAARKETQGKMTKSNIDRVNKMTFNKLTQNERIAINELYAADNDGRTMDQDKAYDQVHKYKGLISQYR